MSPDTSQQSIKIMLVDRDKLVSHGFRLLITLSNPAFRIAGEASTGAEALALAECEQPDVILLELQLGEESGFEILEELLKSSSKSSVLVLTQSRNAEDHRRAMMLGASGVVQKDVDIHVLLKAIEKVHAGEIWFDRSKLGSVLRDIVRNGNGRKADPNALKVASLTPREHEVIALVSKGLKNREIGSRLFISETTVRHHLTSIFEKLGVSNRLELIIFAFSQGLASLPENDHQGNGRSVLGPVEMISGMQN